MDKYIHDELLSENTRILIYKMMMMVQYEIVASVFQVIHCDAT